MASIINALTSGTGGIVTAGDASGILQLQTANTAALTIDGSQNVGIGTASPASLFHVAGNIRSSSGSNYALYSNNFLRSYAAGTFYYDNATVGQSSVWRTSVSSALDTSALTLTAGGILALNNAATNANGVGITFPATQSASSDANTLDDYEEGTWTPNVYHTSSNNSTWTLKNGYYTKVGRLVTAWFVCDSGNSGTGGSNLLVSGLPFALGSVSGALTWGIWATNGSVLNGGFNQGSGGATTFYFYTGGNNITQQQTYSSGSLTYFTS